MRDYISGLNAGGLDTPLLLEATAEGYERATDPAVAVGSRVHAPFKNSGANGRVRMLFGTVVKAGKHGKWKIEFDDSTKKSQRSRTIPGEDLRVITPEIFGVGQRVFVQFEGEKNSELNLDEEFWHEGRISSAATSKLNVTTYTINYADGMVRSGVHGQYIMR